MRILVIEDNERLARLVVDGLQRRGFSCDIALGLSEAAISHQETTSYNDAYFSSI